MLNGNLRTTRNISLRPVSTVTGTLALALAVVAAVAEAPSGPPIADRAITFGGCQ
jgi:hypothetical protein